MRYADSAITLKILRNDQTSIRQVLFRWLLVPLIALLAIAGFQSYSVALNTATQAYDGALLDAALSLFNVMVETGKKEELTHSEASDIMLRTDQFDKIYYSVRDSQTGALTSGDPELALPAFATAVSEPSYYDSTLKGEPTRVVVLRKNHYDADVVIQVAETTIKRKRLFHRVLITIVTREIFLIIAAVVLTWFALGKGLEPLQRLRKEIEARSHKDLRRVSESHAPVEVRSLVRALNNLLEQLEYVLQRQQLFIADAAHQLRTPLAGLRMQVELGLQQKDPSQWLQTLRILKPVTDRTSRLANQLLTLAKAEIGANKVDAVSTVDLSVIVEQMGGTWMQKAITKEIDFGLELDSTRVRGDALLLGELVSNLVDNAIIYTPNGGRITVRCMVRDGKAMIEVQDNGIGIPEQERENIFKRFYRLQDSPGEGSGLGLAIVNEIVRLHDGAIEIRSPDNRGTLFVVTLPLATEE